jgi:hypothetical protein
LRAASISTQERTAAERLIQGSAHRQGQMCTARLCPVPPQKREPAPMYAPAQKAEPAASYRRNFNRRVPDIPARGGVIPSRPGTNLRSAGPVGPFGRRPFATDGCNSWGRTRARTRDAVPVCHADDRPRIKPGRPKQAPQDSHQHNSNETKPAGTSRRSSK